jgi:hypothetical protein
VVALLSALALLGTGYQDKKKKKKKKKSPLKQQ